MERVAVAGLTEFEQATFDRLLETLRAKQRRNLLRASYYDGKRAILQVGSVIPPQYYRLGIVLGWSAKAVDTLADRCNLERFDWPSGDLDSIGNAEVFDSNELGLQIASGIVSSLVYGVSYAINTRGESGEPESLVHFKDARNALGEWNPRIHRLANLLSVTGWDENQPGKPTGFALYLPDLTVIAEKDSSGWQVDRSEHLWGVPAEPLVYKPRTDDRHFGYSRISRTVMSLHDAALRTSIRMEGHADVYSFPEMWLLGADESIFKNPDGSTKESWQIMLGRIKGIPDDEDAENPRADVKQFSASDPKPHIDQFKQQAMQFAGETSIPLTSLGVSDMSNPTSADSYVASREDLVAVAEKATNDWWGPRLARVHQRALAIQNGLSEIPREWRTIAPKWRSPLHMSRAAEADAGLKILTAAPELRGTQVGYEILGLSDQQIQSVMADRRRMEGRGVLDTLREAAQRVTDANAGRPA